LTHALWLDKHIRDNSHPAGGTMRRICLVAAGCAILAISAMAQSKHSGVGTWKVDMSQSDFGSGPAPKSVTVTILKDTPKMLSWRVHMLDDKGKPINYSWSGPEDGSMHPVMQGGKEIGKQSAKKQDDGSLLRHGEDPDGSSFDARSKLSEDGTSMNEETTEKSKDGKESKQKIVYHRVRAVKEAAEKKAEA
jgi:hypothetical protein